MGDNTCPSWQPFPPAGGPSNVQSCHAFPAYAQPRGKTPPPPCLTTYTQVPCAFCLPYRHAVVGWRRGHPAATYIEQPFTEPPAGASPPAASAPPAVALRQSACITPTGRVPDVELCLCNALEMMVREMFKSSSAPLPSGPPSSGGGLPADGPSSAAPAHGSSVLGVVVPAVAPLARSRAHPACSLPMCVVCFSP
jgi:hypothetical protein